MAESTTDTELLISEVRQISFLYDSKDAEYKNQERKNVAWESIGRSLGLSGKLMLCISLKELSILTILLNSESK